MSARKSPVASRASIFRRTDEGVPELSEQQNSKTSEHSDSATASRMKRTFYLPSDDVLRLSELQLAEQRRTGRKPELSTLVSKAIRLLAENPQQDS